MWEKSNVVLIGMPGCGKSTLGVVLAKTMGKCFVDTDLLIQEDQKELLQNLVDQLGTERFLKLEEQILAEVKVKNTVIATGGSAVYGAEAMAHLKQDGYVVYINLSLQTIQQRLDNIKTRGIAMEGGVTLEMLYKERIPLYERYSDLIIDGEGKSIEESVEEIISKASEALQHS